MGAEYFRPKEQGGESYEIVVVIVEHRDIEVKARANQTPITGFIAD